MIMRASDKWMARNIPDRVGKRAGVIPTRHSAALLHGAKPAAAVNENLHAGQGVRRSSGHNRIGAQHRIVADVAQAVA